MRIGKKVGAWIAAVLALGIMLLWLSIEIQGGGPPRIHKTYLADEAVTFKRSFGRWPNSMNDLQAGMPVEDAGALGSLMNGCSVSFYELKGGGLVVHFEWNQFGYARSSMIVRR